MGFWKNIFKAKKWKKANIDYSKLPTHIAIIMDGMADGQKKELFHVPWGTGKVPNS